MPAEPEQQARQEIERLLETCGWNVQDLAAVNLGAGRGVAIREFPLRRGYGSADYLLYVEGKAAGVVEAKREGETLSGYEVQTERYSLGLPDALPGYGFPLPFLYQRAPALAANCRRAPPSDPVTGDRGPGELHGPGASPSPGANGKRRG